MRLATGFKPEMLGVQPNHSARIPADAWNIINRAGTVSKQIFRSTTDQALQYRMAQEFERL
ncbi:MAG TPA: hypothetical protein VF897_17490, partial [Roseiflexaceae bacterium]